MNINFSEKLPLSLLHWMISDKTGSIVVESMKEGLKIYDNLVGVLTNNPPFDMQLFVLNRYRRGNTGITGEIHDIQGLKSF